MNPTLDVGAEAGPRRKQISGAVLQSNSGDIGYCLTASAQGSLDAETETETLIAQPVSFGAQNAAAQGDGVDVGFVPALDKSKTPAVAFQERGREGGRNLEIGGEVAFALTAPNGGGRAQERMIALPWAVRRLTPRECERLQGFPDDFTRIPYRGKQADLCPDGPRYKALGNSWAVNCADWIAQRLNEVNAWADEPHSRITGQSAHGGSVAFPNPPPAIPPETVWPGAIIPQPGGPSPA